MNHRPAFHIVTQRNAGCISLTKDEKGRQTLTLPLGAPDDAAEQFLAGWAAGAQWCGQQAISSESQAHDRMTEWSQRMDMPCPVLCFDEDRRRWAHCAWQEETIFLHRVLLRLPEEVLVENIAHELLHFRIHEHSPLFWQELTKQYPTWPYWEGFLRGWAKHTRGRRQHT